MALAEKHVQQGVGCEDEDKQHDQREALFKKLMPLAHSPGLAALKTVAIRVNRSAATSLNVMRDQETSMAAAEDIRKSTVIAETNFLEIRDEVSSTCILYVSFAHL